MVGTFPVVELFGPTIQGEGPEQGQPAFFVRFGGCDFRCSWCDSEHAVDPAAVRANARRLSVASIEAEIAHLEQGPDLVVLSGGNPALLELSPLVEALHGRSLRVAVETQGSRWKQWLGTVDSLVVSPKGPSSGMDTDAHRDQFRRFMDRAAEARVATALKVVVFGPDDLEYAASLVGAYPDAAMFLSVGTELGVSDSVAVAQMQERLSWLSEAVARDARMPRVRVGIQQHVLAWGTRKGV